MENNLENKARFVAQYLGAQITYPDTDNKLITCKLHGVSLSEIETTYKRKKKGCVGDILSFKSNGNHNSDFINAYLELKSINEISDEDAEELGGLLGWKHPQEYRKHFLENHTHGDSLEQFEVDFLREKGYALPWMGLSVDELINFGWVKLKEKNDGK